MLQQVLSAYGLKEEEVIVESFGSGLINNTWKVLAADKVYILQRVNHTVFKKPQDIADNIRLISDHLNKYYPEYLFTTPLKTLNNDEMVFIKEEGFFRLFPFVAGSHTIDVVEKSEQAYEAAVQFGRFTRLSSGIDIGKFKMTIPDFHNLSLRHEQFEDTLKNGNKERIHESLDLIKSVARHSNIAERYRRITSDAAFHLRITHHDTKISNVLFDKNDKGLCVIDLDTVMPGHFISDVGDMFRTYLSPAGEEEKDSSKIEIRDDYYKAVVHGYMDEMKDELTDTEKKYFFYAGKFMIYMQAMRFLTDYLNDDIYYGEKYPGHNLARAKNQFTLLGRLLEKETILSSEKA